MKNQYFGDVNDYRKYGLLRLLSSCGQLKIGVCWMLTAGDGGNDGNLTRYLQNPRRWRDYDPPLFDRLRQWVLEDHSRHVHNLSVSDLIPETIFHEDILTDSLSGRHAYFASMRAALQDADLLFFDPDNGLEVKSIPLGRAGSAKYVYWSELCDAWNSGQSLLVYQHFCREARLAFSERLSLEFITRLPGVRLARLRTPQVVYFLAMQPRHVARLSQKVNQILENWRLRKQIVGEICE